MSQAPSMPMFWDAYIADTTHLTTEEHGAYLLLLGAMWRRNGWVPDDDKDNARILGLTVAKWRKTKARLSTFLTFENGEISQKNLLKIWKNTQEKIEKNRENGSKGGRLKSKENNDVAKANGSVSDNPNETIPEPEPEPEVKEEAKASSKKKRKTSIPDDAAISDRMLEIAHELGVSAEQARAQFDLFKGGAIANGRTYADWDAAWRNWLKSPYFKPVLVGGYDGQSPRTANQTRSQHGGGYGQRTSIASVIAQDRASGRG